MSFYRNENMSKGVLQQTEIYSKVIDPPTSAIEGKKNLGMLSGRMSSILRAEIAHDQWDLGAVCHEQPDQALS